MCFRLKRKRTSKLSAQSSKAIILPSSVMVWRCANPDLCVGHYCTICRWGPRTIEQLRDIYQTIMEINFTFKSLFSVVSSQTVFVKSKRLCNSGKYACYLPRSREHVYFVFTFVLYLCNYVDKSVLVCAIFWFLCHSCVPPLNFKRVHGEIDSNLRRTQI